MNFFRLFVFTICLYISTITLWAQSDLPKIKSHLEFSEKSFDFGVLKSDELLTHVFHFTNTGQDTIEIYKVGSSWGCTAALLSSGVIAPGDSGEIKISLDPKNKVGKLNKTIRVFTSDELSPLIKLNVLAEIKIEDMRKISAPHLKR